MVDTDDTPRPLPDSPKSVPERGELLRWLTMVGLLVSILLTLLGGAWQIGKALSDNHNLAQDQCQAIIQLDANLRFYEQAIASAKRLTPPPKLDLTC